MHICIRVDRSDRAKGDWVHVERPHLKVVSAHSTLCFDLSVTDAAAFRRLRLTGFWHVFQARGALGLKPCESKA